MLVDLTEWHKELDDKHLEVLLEESNNIVDNKQDENLQSDDL